MMCCILGYSTVLYCREEGPRETSSVDFSPLLAISCFWTPRLRSWFPALEAKLPRIFSHRNKRDRCQADEGGAFESNTFRAVATHHDGLSNPAIDINTFALGQLITIHSCPLFLSFSSLFLFWSSYSLQMISTLFAAGLLLIPSVNAFWRLPCAKPVLNSRVDPIVAPGGPSGHGHTIMGSSGALHHRKTSSKVNLIWFIQPLALIPHLPTCAVPIARHAWSRTICLTTGYQNWYVAGFHVNARGYGKLIGNPSSSNSIMDHSRLFLTVGCLCGFSEHLKKRVLPDQRRSYYLQRNAPNETVEAFPDGLRMLTGDPLLRNYTGSPASKAISWLWSDPFSNPCDH